MSNELIISMNNIYKSYYMGDEKIVALDNINFFVEKGEFVSIVGPSGSRQININEYFGIAGYS